MVAVPQYLDEAGTSLWNDVVNTHDLRPDELRVLEDACRETDLIALMESERRKPGFNIYSRGAQGQQVINPLISELRQHRATVANLLKQLKLTEGETSESVSNKNRAAAQARWARVRPA